MGLLLEGGGGGYGILYEKRYYAQNAKQLPIQVKHLHENAPWKDSTKTTKREFNTHIN